MRPDELANQSQIDLENKFKRKVGNAASTAVGLGTGAIAGSLSSSVMPFLNQYIPADLAMKGINKVAPKLGAFLRRGKEAGLNVEEGLNFLKDKFGASEEGKTKDKRSIIEQESPELHQFIDQEIRKGRQPIEAAALAQHDKRFAPIIEKLMKTHKTPWSQIIESVFGNGQMAQPNQTQQAQPQQQQQSPQQAQPGQGQQALMAILQKINQRLGA